MESNHAVQLKPFYPHSHMNLYNSPVISTTMPNLTLANGFALVNASNNSNTASGNQGQTIDALTTLQASSANPSLTLPNAAQLMPMTALNNIQFHQIQPQGYADQADVRMAGNHHTPIKSLHIQISNPHPEMSQQSTINVTNSTTHLANTTVGLSAKKLSNITEVTHLKGSAVSANPTPSSTKGSTSQASASVKIETRSDILTNDFSNKYAIINNGKGFRCLVCNREFTQKGNLKTHAMTHLGPTERPYDCETCGKRFTQKGNRDIHVKIHTGTKDHRCPYCDRGFTQRGNLKTHIRSVHTGEKPFSCGHCGKTFSQKANMLTHYRTHDKNSRFACNTCGKTFSQKGNLKTHQQRHIQVDRS